MPVPQWCNYTTAKAVAAHTSQDSGAYLASWPAEDS